MPSFEDVLTHVSPAIQEVGIRLRDQRDNLAQAVSDAQVEIDELAPLEAAARELLSNPAGNSIEAMKDAHTTISVVVAKREVLVLDLEQTKNLAFQAKSRFTQWRQSFQSHVDAIAEIDFEIAAWQQRQAWHHEILNGNKTNMRPGLGPLSRRLADQLDMAQRAASQLPSEVQ